MLQDVFFPMEDDLFESHEDFIDECVGILEDLRSMIHTFELFMEKYEYEGTNIVHSALRTAYKDVFRCLNNL